MYYPHVCAQRNLETLSKSDGSSRLRGLICGEGRLSVGFGDDERAQAPSAPMFLPVALQFSQRSFTRRSRFLGRLSPFGAFHIRHCLTGCADLSGGIQVDSFKPLTLLAGHSGGMRKGGERLPGK
jgi:hypothetical protein